MTTNGPCGTFYTIAMTDPVLVGLANASSSNSTANTATFNNFHLCLDPGNASSCGAVSEASGLAIVNATNYTANITRNSRSWQETIIGGPGV